MPSRSQRTAYDRAEARRRARLASRGIEANETDDDAEGEGATAANARPRQPAGSFLTRLFPPAPPLPGKPDPLARFAYAGPFRGLVAGIYLLARNPRAWMLTGAVWAIGRVVTGIAPATVPGLLGSLVSFGAVILAGWIGWQRPWAFGLAASFLGIVIYAGIWAALLNGLPVPDTEGERYVGSEVLGFAVANEVLTFQPLFGVVAGWYGGYLRRRMAAAPRSGDRRPARRR